MSPIASEWLKLALKDAREEIAAWPEWLRASSEATVPDDERASDRRDAQKQCDDEATFK
jgi:hypothetical protein